MKYPAFPRGDFYFVQILSSEDKNLQENKTKTVQGTASGTADIFYLPKQKRVVFYSMLPTSEHMQGGER